MHAFDDRILVPSYLVTAWSVTTWLVTTLVATALFWLTFGACVDAPLPPDPPQARLVASWDPLVCGDPHRVVVELEDADGVPLSRSAPCAVGGLSLDVPHFGIYQGRVYAWASGPTMRSVEPVHLTIDEPVVQWLVDTPR